MTDKFNLYDFIAVIIPGIFFLWSITLISDILGFGLNLSVEGDLTNTTIIIVIGYVIGLLLQGVSQGITEKTLKLIWGGFPSERWLLDNDSKFSQEYKLKLWEKVSTKFDRSKPLTDEKLKEKERLIILRKKNQEIFYLIYSYIEKEKLTEKHQTFNAQYGLFRCLLTIFFILFVIIFYLLLFHIPNTDQNLLFAVFSLVGTIISYFRVKKRGEDFVKCIFDAFSVS